jgi:hypothetical protein
MICFMAWAYWSTEMEEFLKAISIKETPKKELLDMLTEMSTLGQFVNK